MWATTARRAWCPHNSDPARYVRSLRKPHDVEGRRGFQEPLEAELADGLGLDLSFHGRVNALAHEYLATPRRVAEPRGEVGYRADRAIVESPFEADLAQRRGAARGPAAEFESEAAFAATARGPPDPATPHSC